MKEFSAQTGGRYTYTDDIINLQNLALAFAAVFDECDNFIVSGCKTSGASISSGYVYINGKLRYFSGASGCTWPQYIYENNNTETVAYENGANKVGRNVYGCGISNSVPTVKDQLTNEIPQSILISATGGKQLKDALFGKYALILDPATGTQDIKGIVNFSGNISLNGAMSVRDRVIVKSGSSIGQIYYENGAFVIQSKIGDGKIYRIALSNDSGFLFYVNSILAMSFNGESIECKSPVVSDTGKLGNARITGSDIYNDKVSTDAGSLYINRLGYNGANQYYRNTYIGNGKNGIILGVDGKNSLVSISGRLDVSGPDVIGLLLQSNYIKTNNSLRKIISWTDALFEEIGHIGYNSSTSNVFEIRNSLANVLITGLEAVNLGPAIMENGTLLSTKYTLKTDFDTTTGKLAASDNVYSKTDANSTFATFSGGLSQFVKSPTTKATLRQQIDAVSLDDVLKKAPELTKYLSDMATGTDAKKKICENIGAAYGGDFQPKMKDSGWNSLGEELHIRQIGNIVSIQGYLRTIHSGIVFSIPLSIDSPAYAVAFTTVTSSYTELWRCHIDAHSRSCTVDYCNNHGARIPFSIIYMV
jgi:hypothetical protein